MKVALSLDGGVVLELESELDWTALEAMVEDSGRPGDLAESLAGLMDEESEWDEWVVPELVEGFEGQFSHVKSAITHARNQGDSRIEITPEEADLWYGAINQSRLALQARYRFDVISSMEEQSEEVQLAYLRDRIYTSLQGILLEYVMS